jgi:hypothetical protein
MNNNFPEMGSPVLRSRNNNNNNNNNNNKKTNNKHPKNVNVTVFFNKKFNTVNKKNIPANKRSFLVTNVRSSGNKVRTVYDIRALKKWLQTHNTSPMTRIPYTLNNIKKYPNELPKPLIIKMKRGSSVKKAKRA